MRRRTQGEMDQLVEAAGFRKIGQRIDEWGIFTVSLAERVAGERYRRAAAGDRPAVAARGALARSSSRRSSTSPTARRTGSRRAAAASAPSSSAGNTASRSSAGRSSPTGRSTPSTACRSSSARRARSSTRTRKRLLTAQIVAVACFLAVSAALHLRAAGAAAAGSPASCSTRSAPSTSRSTRRRRCMSRCSSSSGRSTRGMCRAGRAAAACLVRADRRFGADHLSAPFHRHPDRRAARPRLPLALAGREREPVRRRAASRATASGASSRSAISPAPCLLAGARVLARRPWAAPVLAGVLARPRRGELCRLRRGRLPEAARRHDEPRRQADARALSSRRFINSRAVDAERSGRRRKSPTALHSAASRRARDLDAG